MWRRIVLGGLLVVSVVVAQSALEHLQITETEVTGEVATPQERIDTLRRALLRLPQPELDRLGISDLSSHEVQAGSEEAERLLDIWKARQEELRALAASMVKPAEHMQSIMNTIASNIDDTSLVVERLIELEGVLTDIDNARDFHTLKLWTPLTSYLSASYAPAIRAAAAWCIGTAVKNTYDHQLWTIEPLDNQVTSSTALVLLLQNAHEAAQHSTSEYDLLLRRCLYAIAAAIRGNLDVQAEVASSHNSYDLVALLSLLRDSTLSPQVLRKTWAIAQDLLSELAYIRLEFSNVPEIASQRLLGEVIMEDKQWLLTAINASSIYLAKCFAGEVINTSCEYYQQPDIRSTIDSMVEFMKHCKETCDDEKFLEEIRVVDNMMTMLNS